MSLILNLYVDLFVATSDMKTRSHNVAEHRFLLYSSSRIKDNSLNSILILKKMYYRGIFAVFFDL